ncbi:MAG: hypothetical protein ACYCQJ_15645 [Nitrososphaerales archaeon]
MDYDYNIDLDSVRILTHNRWGKRITRPDSLDEHDVRWNTGKVLKFPLHPYEDRFQHWIHFESVTYSNRGYLFLFWTMNMDGFINSKFPFCRIYSDHILSGVHLDSAYLEPPFMVIMEKARRAFRRYPYSYVIAK